MEIEAARTATPLVASIDARTEMLALLQSAVAGNFVVTSMKMFDPASHMTHDIILGQLDDQTSQQCFAFAIQIYQTQLAALNGELAQL